MVTRMPFVAPSLWTLPNRPRTALTGTVVCGSVAWLFGTVSPAQPDQAVLAEAGVAVQAASSGEAAVVGDACPVAAFQLAQRSDREGDRAGADADGERERSLLAGLGKGDPGCQSSAGAGPTWAPRTSAMKTTSAHPTGNNSSLTPFASSEGSGVGAD